MMQLKKEEDMRLLNLGKRSIGLIGMAFTSWVIDRFFCPYWASIGFPYLHGVWHILIFLSAYTSIVLFAYYDVVNHMKNKVPVLMYYPLDKFELGVPYVFVQDKASRVEKRHKSYRIQ